MFVRPWVLLSCCISICVILGWGDLFQSYTKNRNRNRRRHNLGVYSGLWWYSCTFSVCLSSACFASKYSYLRGLLWREGSSWASHRLADEEAQILSSFALKQNINLRLHLKLQPCLVSRSFPYCFPTHFLLNHLHWIPWPRFCFWEKLLQAGSENLIWNLVGLISFEAWKPIM